MVLYRIAYYIYIYINTVERGCLNLHYNTAFFNLQCLSTVARMPRPYTYLGTDAVKLSPQIVLGPRRPLDFKLPAK
jgi:hypothetical protein